MKKFILNLLSPKTWLYSTFGNRVLTFSLGWRMLAGLLLCATLGAAFFIHPVFAVLNGTMGLFLIGIKIYNMILKRKVQRAGKSPGADDTQPVLNHRRNGKKAIVIGAGPTGLTTAKTLREAGYEVFLLEGSTRIGGNFAQYPADIQLTSSRHMIAFSDFPLEAESDFLSIGTYLEYLKKYVSHFKLDDCIRFNSWVTRVEELDNGKIQVHYSKNGIKKTKTVDKVAVCTGLHTRKKEQGIIANFDGPIHRQAGEDMDKNIKRVVVRGSGETAWEMVKRCLKKDHIDEIYVSIPNGFFPFPNELKKEYFCMPSLMGNNNTADVQVPPMFLYLWMHPWLLKSRLFYFLVDGIALPLYFAFIQPFGVKNGKKILPKEGFPSSIQHFIMKTEIGGDLGIIGNLDPRLSKVKYITEELQFQEGNKLTPASTGGQEVPIDALLDATGFQTPGLGFLDFDPEITVRHILDPKHPNIAFIGYVRPSIGAIPPLGEAQAIWWTQIDEDKITTLSSEGYSMLPPKSKKTKKHGLHFDAYFCQLAQDIEATPQLKDVWQHPRAFMAFAGSHGGPHLLRTKGKAYSEKATEIALNKFIHCSLFSSSGLWFAFLFMLMLPGIIALAWMSVTLKVLEPVLRQIKTPVLKLWNFLLGQFCDTKLILRQGTTDKLIRQPRSTASDDEVPGTYKHAA